MSTLALDDYGARIQALRPGTALTLNLGLEATISPPIATGISVVRLVATTTCRVAIGSTADLQPERGHYLPAETPEYFRIAPGDRLAALAVDAGGVLHISEMM